MYINHKIIIPSYSLQAAAKINALDIPKMKMQSDLKPREKLNVCQNGYSYRTILMESAIRNTDFIWLILPITAIIFHSGESLLKFVVNWRMRFFISDKVVGLYTQPLYFCIIIQTYFGPLFQEKWSFSGAQKYIQHSKWHFQFFNN